LKENEQAWTFSQDSTDLFCIRLIRPVLWAGRRAAARQVPPAINYFKGAGSAQAEKMHNAGHQ